MRDKVKLKINKGKATIEEGGDTILGRLLAGHKGKIKVDTPLYKGEMEITKKPKRRKATAKK